MKIIELQAENVKRLRAISIKPDGNLVEITGQNGAGKSSTLDAIWWALTGLSNVQSKPIRKGEEAARIYLDLGELKVTRTFKQTESGDFTSAIAVETVEGAKFGSPQKMLDTLVGELSFDPLAFSRLPAAAQFGELKKLVPDVDFDAIEAANKEDFDRRRDANRSAKEARSAEASISVPADTPDEPIDEAELVAELERAGEENSKLERRKARREQAARDVETAERTAAADRERADEMRRNADKLAEQAAEQERHAAEQRKALQDAPALPEPIDTTDIRARIAAARTTNADVARKLERVEHGKRAERLEARSGELTTAMEVRNAAKVKAIADAKLPVAGLTLDDGVVLLSGIPLDQASDAEQLRTSIAVAMALNPKLRVIRVRDGSLLDDRSMEILAEMAGDNDFQIWIETVASGRPGAIVIEDGAVKTEAA